MGRQEAVSEAARLTTVQILGAIALLTGLLIALTAPQAGPSFILVQEFWWWPEAIGFVLVLSGATQVISIPLDMPKLAAIACYVSMAWYACFGSIFIWTWVVWSISDHIGVEPSLYPTVVYFGLAVLHFIQAWTITRKKKVQNQEDHGL